MESFTLKDIIEALKKDPNGDFSTQHLRWLSKGPRATDDGILTISIYSEPIPFWTDIEKLYEFNGKIMKHKKLEYFCYYHNSTLWFELV